VRAFLAVIVVAACKPAAAPRFTLRIAVSGPLAPMGPDAELRSWTVVAQEYVFEPLVNIGLDGEILPALAAKAEIAGTNGLRVWLRGGAQFSDGSPVTFADVADSVAASKLRATNEGQSILVTSSEPGVPIELLLSRTFIFRRAGNRVSGTGEFAVAEEDATHLLVNRLQSEPGFIDRVRVDSYPTPQEAFARTLKGDADFLVEVEPRWVEFFEGVPRLRILRAPGTRANMVAFNPARLSRSERLALAGALAADDIRRLAFGDDCVPPGRRPGIEPLPAGRALEVLALPFFDRFAFVVRRALTERGGAVRVVEAPDFIATVRSGGFDLATFRFLVWPAAFVWRTGAESNLLGYSNPAVDAAIDARNWTGAQRALEEDPPGAVVCTPPSVLVLDARIKVPPFSPGGFMRSLPRWEVLQ